MDRRDRELRYRVPQRRRARAARIDSAPRPGPHGVHVLHKDVQPEGRAEAPPGAVLPRPAARTHVRRVELLDQLLGDAQVSVALYADFEARF